jgi:hypothetical protein
LIELCERFYSKELPESRKNFREVETQKRRGLPESSFDFREVKAKNVMNFPKVETHKT